MLGSTLTAEDEEEVEKELLQLQKEAGAVRRMVKPVLLFVLTGLTSSVRSRRRLPKDLLFFHLRLQQSRKWKNRNKKVRDS